MGDEAHNQSRSGPTRRGGESVVATISRQAAIPTTVAAAAAEAITPGPIPSKASRKLVSERMRRTKPASTSAKLPVPTRPNARMPTKMHSVQVTRVSALGMLHNLEP